MGDSAGNSPPISIRGGEPWLVSYCWQTPFKVLGVLFSGKSPQEQKKTLMKRMMDAYRSTASRYFSSMAAAITATMITIAPTINQFLPLLRLLATRYSCCCLSCVALCAVHRASFSCRVSSGSAMVFPSAIRAVVVYGFLQPETLPLAQQS